MHKTESVLVAVSFLSHLPAPGVDTDLPALVEAQT